MNHSSSVLYHCNPQLREARERLGDAMPKHIRDAVLREQHEEASLYFGTFPVLVFDRTWTVGASDPITHDAKLSALEWLGKYGINKCVVCGTERGLSAAHILKNVKALEHLGLQAADMDHTNFLCLCGTEGKEGTCRDKFDKGRISFMHIADKTWHIIGGEKHLTEVTLHNGPHKRSLQTHLAWCVVNGALEGKDKLSDWLKGIRETTLPNKEMWTPEEVKNTYHTPEQKRRGEQEANEQGQSKQGRKSAARKKIQVPCRNGAACRFGFKCRFLH